MSKRAVLVVAAGLTVLTVLAAAIIFVALGPSGSGRLVRTDRGVVAGLAHDGIISWRGIPYAQPPVGERRWQPPAPVERWDGTRPATDYGPSCLQAKPYEFQAPSSKPNPASSEDCLYLNVNRPAGSTTGSTTGNDTGLPVLVWVHGGGFVIGTGNGGPANKPGLVKRGVVVVTINYRLGRMGFFAHPSLGGRVANFGLLDQVAALQWVHDNIAAFGGDPERVTVAGESAGGMSVNALMSSPSASGLFDQAISQSGLGNEVPDTLAEARTQGADSFPDLDAAQLRALPAADLLSSTFNVFAGDAPILDDVLPRRVADVFEAGDEADVPYLVGSTDDEFSDTDFTTVSANPDQMRAALGGGRHAELVAAYGTDDYDQALNDVIFGAPALRLAREHARTASTYRYRFAVDPAGSRHGSDVRFVFDAVGDAEQSDVAGQVADLWAAFVATGTPSVPGLPTWPQADGSDGSGLMELTSDGPRALSADPWQRRLDAVDEIVNR